MYCLVGRNKKERNGKVSPQLSGWIEE
jgi:hypothetical protein